MRKRILSILLVVVMCLTMMPTTTFAADTCAGHTDEDGDNTCDTCTATLYDLWVGGVRVASDTTSGDGWTYDSATNTLTLTEATLTSAELLTYLSQGTKYACAIYAGSYYGSGIQNNLNIVLNGTNTIDSTSDVATSMGILCNGDLNISGSGSLDISVAVTATGKNAYGIYAGSEITIDGSEVTAKAAGGGGYGINGAVVTINSGTVKAEGPLAGIYSTNNVIINGGNVTATGGTNGISLYSANGTITIADGAHVKAVGGTYATTNRTARVAPTVSGSYHARGSATDDFVENMALDSIGEYLEIVTAGHLGYIQNGNTHSRGCAEGCGISVTLGESEACSGGTATCTNKAVCGTCGQGYGAEPTGHNWSDWQSTGDTQHTRTCNNNGCGTTETGGHTGGTATCTEKAVCTVCNESYGETNPNNHAGTSYTDGFRNCCGEIEPAVNNDGVYEISNAGQLLWFASEVNSGNTTISGKLMNSIDLSGVTYTPIGTESNPYTGTFNGQGYSIKNMTINTTAEYQGLFGVVGAGVLIKNVVIDASCSVTGGNYTAALVGGSKRSTSGTVTIENCINYASVSGGMHTGGIFGCNTGDDATIIIRNCANLGNITGGKNCGTIAGYLGTNTVGTLENCWNTGTLTATSGDSFAHLDAANITNCWNLNTLTASTKDGVSTFTEEELANGALAYKLGTPWGQTIGTNNHPVLNGKAVYYGYLSCGMDAVMVYSNNSSASEEKPAHTGGTATCTDKAVCTVCGESYGDLLTHVDSADDGDHVCDYGCGATLENCTDAENDNDHACDICGKADVSDHTYGDATCTSPAACSECEGTTGDALGHIDANNDHTCDRDCGETELGEHTDSATDRDHVCDYGCGAVLEEHTGGTATCTQKALCEVCNAPYGSFDNHTFGNDGICTVCGTEKNPVVDISQGNIILSESGGKKYYQIGSKNAAEYTGSFTITGSTSEYSVTVQNGTHDIILNGVNIDVSGTKNAAAFLIKGGASVTLTLADGTANTLKSGYFCAGLQVEADSALTINGTTGSLTATGGSDGAGIGGGFGDGSANSDSGYSRENGGSSGEVTINGGIITAQAGEYGAGIGGGRGAYGGGSGTVIINGGVVSATGNQSGVGVGGGAGIGYQNGTCTVTINGGIVTANRSGAEAIGGVNGTVTISGDSHVKVNGPVMASTNLTVTGDCYARTEATGTFASALPETFGEYLEIVTASHMGEFTQSNDTHSLACKSGCGMSVNIFDNISCSGGTATCETTAICSVCGNTYGSPLGHDWNDWVIASGTHSRTCKNDNSHTESGNHSGGTATCTEKAVCEACDSEYGELNPNNHASTKVTYKNNNDGTHTVTHTCCGSTETENHFYTDGKCACGEGEMVSVGFATTTDVTMDVDSAPYGQELKVTLTSTVGKEIMIVRIYAGKTVITDYTFENNVLTIPGECVTNNIIIDAYSAVTVTVNLNGGTVSDDVAAELKALGAVFGEDSFTMMWQYGEAFPALTGMITREGYTYTGLTLTDGTAYDHETLLTENTTFTCQWTSDGTSSIISVTITWTDMSFTYNKGTWNTETLTWENGGWTADDGCGTVTVENTGDVDINAEFTVNITDADYTSLSVGFTVDGTALTDNKLKIPVSESKTVSVTLTGDEPEAYIEDKKTIGQITIVLSTE